MVWEGEGVILSARKLIGSTKPLDAEPGTIRGDLAVDIGRNINHGSDGEETAKSENTIDLFKLVKELKSREINPPLIIRFNDILKDRINALHDSFFKAIKTYKYKNIYQGVFPVKCNQQKNVLEKIIEFGSQWNFGLEVGSKSELLIGLALLENQNSLLICNGYKDKKYIEIATLARKLGKNPIIVIEQRDEVKRIIQAVQELNATPLILSLIHI